MKRRSQFMSDIRKMNSRYGAGGATRRGAPVAHKMRVLQSSIGTVVAQTQDQLPSWIARPSVCQKDIDRVQQLIEEKKKGIL